MLKGVIENEYTDHIVLDSKQIARHYMRTWLPIDLLSSIPFDYLFLILGFANQNYEAAKTSGAIKVNMLIYCSDYVMSKKTFLPKVFRLVKLLSLLRFLRLFRLVRYIYEWKEVSKRIC